MKKLILLIIFMSFQTVMFSQKVTVHVTNQPISEVIRSIARQTGKNFVYSTDLLKGRRINLNVKNQPYKQTLHNIFNETDIEWKIKGKNIILKRKVMHNNKVKEKRKIKRSIDLKIDTTAIEPKMLEEVVVFSRLEAPTTESPEIGSKKLTV